MHESTPFFVVKEDCPACKEYGQVGFLIVYGDLKLGCIECTSGWNTIEQLERHYEQAYGSFNFESAEKGLRPDFDDILRSPHASWKVIVEHKLDQYVKNKPFWIPLQNPILQASSDYVYRLREACPECGREDALCIIRIDTDHDSIACWHCFSAWDDYGALVKKKKTLQYSLQRIKESPPVHWKSVERYTWSTMINKI